MIGERSEEEIKKQAAWKAGGDVIVNGRVEDYLPPQLIEAVNKSDADRKAKEDKERKANYAHFPGDGRESGVPREVKYLALAKKIEEAVGKMESDGKLVGFDDLADIVTDMLREEEADGESVELLNNAEKIRQMPESLAKLMKAKVDVRMIKNVMFPLVAKELGLEKILSEIIDRETGNQQTVIRDASSLSSGDLPEEGTRVVRPLPWSGPRGPRRTSADSRPGL